MIYLEYNDIFKPENRRLLPRLCLVMLSYFTTLNIVMVILYKFTSPFVDLHLSCLITAFVSFGICYIRPKEWIIPLDENHSWYVTTRGPNSTWVYLRDFAVHWLPLLFVLLFVPIGPVDYRKISFTFFVIIFYLVFLNAPELYGLDVYISIIFVFMAILTRFALIR